MTMHTDASAPRVRIAIAGVMRLFRSKFDEKVCARFAYLFRAYFLSCQELKISICNYCIS